VVPDKVSGGAPDHARLIQHGLRYADLVKDAPIDAIPSGPP
jgi:hypothetical protein